MSRANAVEFDFTLLSPDGEPRLAERREIELILGAFPGSNGITFFDSWIIIRYEPPGKLPPKPWPVRVAGLPLKLTTAHRPTDEFTRSRHWGRGRPLEFSPPLIRWSKPSTDTINALSEHLSRICLCEVRRITWFGARMEIWLAADDLDPSKLPFRINSLMVSYPIGEFPESLSAAFGGRAPQSLNPDDTVYGNHLRPGVMLSNGGLPGRELLTTSGVPVRAPDGTRHFTTSAHGFPSSPSSSTNPVEVWHPTREHGRRVGTIERVLGNTDIALTSLDPGFTYGAEGFEAPGMGADILTALKPKHECKVADIVYLDSPFSGRCEGQAYAFQWDQLPGDSSNPKSGCWLESSWIFFGDGMAEMPDGTRGSAIYDDQGRVMAFFHLAGDNGLAYAIAAHHALEEGLVLEPIV